MNPFYCNSLGQQELYCYLVIYIKPLSSATKCRHFWIAFIFLYLSTIKGPVLNSIMRSNMIIESYVHRILCLSFIDRLLGLSTSTIKNSINDDNQKYFT